MITVRPATLDDAVLFGPLLRAADVAECAAGGYSPVDALAQSLAVSAEAWAAFLGDEPLAVGGVAAESLLADKGFVWLLTTNAVHRARVAFVRESRAWVRRFAESYPHLEAFVDARYESAVRWLRGMGFETVGEVRFAPRGTPFYRMERVVC